MNAVSAVRAVVEDRMVGDDVVVSIRGVDRFKLKKGSAPDGKWCAHPLVGTLLGQSIDCDTFRSELLERIECQYMDCSVQFLEGMGCAQALIGSGAWTPIEDMEAGRSEQFVAGFRYRIDKERSRKKLALPR